MIFTFIEIFGCNRTAFTREMFGKTSFGDKMDNSSQKKMHWYR
jgi:hypothetical protein